ncbi:hypothetical protein QBC46DRAFT_305805 [Diplogelasinospora grovesii]|uniref:Uncharacterized protein n=1 Tax=Diplogelasinospora grovesii TaxID=303347 RepID=A0AAN6NE72_9PEZI|nr:hypothetical protein QBC46DRAFT_305805 [Diplogelasinospora grovesii]
MIPKAYLHSLYSPSSARTVLTFYYYFLSSFLSFPLFSSSGPHLSVDLGTLLSQL